MITKCKRKWIIWLVFLIGITICIFALFRVLRMPLPKDIDKSLVRNIEDLTIIKDYFSDFEYNSVYISRGSDSDGTMYVSNNNIGETGRTIAIDDQVVVVAIQNLFLNENYRIIKVIRNEYIEFQNWATIDKGCGVAYVYDDNEPLIEFSTEWEPLSEPGWYYYVSDYNAYK